tara:strand:- start:40 stop:642 length:603 start_codon:yes stop_codon:yes gene_type:complete
MKFSKKDFQKNYKTKEVDELYDPKKGEIGGDTVITKNQISTDTQVIPADDTTDRKKGISIDSEKFAANTKNTSADIARSIFNMGTPYGYALREDDENLEEEESVEESAKEKMKNMIKELLNSKNDSNDIVKNTNYSDVNRNKIPDVEELEDIHLSKLTSDFIKSFGDKSPEEIAIVINDLIIKLGDSIPSDYKNIIKSKL